MVVTWPMTKNGLKTKVVVPCCSFLNLFELCSEVLLLWRYDVKDFESATFCFFLFFVFLHENKTKQHNFETFRKLKERPTIIVLWERWPKKEGACLRRETDSDRLQSLLIDHRIPQKVGHGLQSLLIDYKRLQKSDRLQSLLTNYKRLQKSDLD